MIRRIARRYCPLTVAMIALVAVSVPVTQAAALNELRLFYSPAERQVIDGDAEVALELPPAARGEDGDVLPQKSGSNEPGLYEPGLRRSDGPTVRSMVPDEDVSQRVEHDQVDTPTAIVFTGVLVSDRGATYLINGMPWAAGRFGIEAIGQSIRPGEIIVTLDGGRTASLVIGEQL